MSKIINYKKLIFLIFLIILLFINHRKAYNCKNIKILMIKKLFNEYNLLFKKVKNVTALFSYYSSLINKYSNKNDLDFKKNPLISIIIPLYKKKDEYILRSIMSIEAQTFKNIEIIYINDFPESNLIFILDILKKIDKRILLLKNKRNRGILYSKSLGVKISRGKYAFVIDQDDMLLSKKLLSFLYENAERYKLDILQFKYSILFEKNKQVKLKQEKNFPKYGSLITQPKLGEIKNFLNVSLGFTYNLWDKLIKKNIYLKAINFIGEDLFNIKIVQREDHIITFQLYKFAKRYMRINIDGYLYIKHKTQATNNMKEKNSLFQDEFTFLYYLYNNTNETEEGKYIFFREFLIIIKLFNICIKVNNDNIKLLVFKVCNLSLNSKFIYKSKNSILMFCKKFKKVNLKK